METLADLKKKLSQLENQLAETKQRLPAHSVKPQIMQELFELEDKIEEIRAEITARSKNK